MPHRKAAPTLTAPVPPRFPRPFDLLVGVLVLIVVIAKEVPVVIGLLVVVVLPTRAALKDKRDEQAYEHAANHEAHHAGPVGEEPGEEVLHT